MFSACPSNKGYGKSKITNAKYYFYLLSLEYAVKMIILPSKNQLRLYFNSLQ